MSANRTIHTADAIAWLKDHSPLEGSSLIASMPDISEFPGDTVSEWSQWFVDTAKLILLKTPDSGVTLFFQSDIKHDSVWIDKGYLVTKAAEELGHPMLFHKILCRSAPGTATYGKPSYSHLLAFSKSVRPNVSRSTADVVPDLGEKTWVRGMGFNACRIACEFLKNETATHTVINPFCGHGSIVSVANFFGFNSIGIERSPKRAEAARSLQVEPNGKGWIEHPRTAHPPKSELESND